jgi:hypothetical protein
MSSYWSVNLGVATEPGVMCSPHTSYQNVGPMALGRAISRGDFTVIFLASSCEIGFGSFFANFRSKALYYPTEVVRDSHGGEKEKMNQEDAYSLARAILLIGGIIAIAFGATALGASLTTARALADILAIPGPLLGVIVGVVALVGSTRIKNEGIAIVMAVLGFIAGGLGGVLVAIGGIWALISRYTLKQA